MTPDRLLVTYMRISTSKQGRHAMPTAKPREWPYASSVSATMTAHAAMKIAVSTEDIVHIGSSDVFIRQS